MNLNTAIEQRFGVPSETGHTVESNPTLESILTRRSLRNFADHQIDPDLMNTLLAAALSAPSKSDLQQARIIWVKDQTLKVAIAELSPDLHGFVARAPEFLVWCGDNTLCHRLAETHGHTYVNNHLDQFMNPAVDAGISLATFMCAAESVGLACCPVSSIRDTPFKLAELLQLPKFVFPVAGLVVGYPREEDQGNISLRLPPSVMVMTNTYTEDVAGTLEQVEDYSRRREAQRPTPPESQRLVELYGEAPEYGWSEDKSRQYAQPARTDWGDFIRKQGFSLE